ncbi:hypothetical protein DL96DRAFT_1722695 [Flagelloscypha sp. PMI_526]|nr:hypothetical protein DL96DRAFT_1722695 [Flagelloscypha sp. PMI_526]
MVIPHPAVTKSNSSLHGSRPSIQADSASSMIPLAVALSRLRRLSPFRLFKNTAPFVAGVFLETEKSGTSSYDVAAANEVFSAGTVSTPQNCSS